MVAEAERPCGGKYTACAADKACVATFTDFMVAGQGSPFPGRIVQPLAIPR